MKRLAILGASGHGKVVADIAKANGISDIVCFDDRWQEIKTLGEYPVVGDVAGAITGKSAFDFDAAIVTIGNPSIRAKIQNQLACIAPPLVHPSAVVSSTATLGRGTVVMANAVINADSKIGDGVIINTGAVVEHDCVIGDFSHVCPNAAIAGGVIIGRGSWVGIGSSIIQLIQIGENVTIGAGSVVIRNISDDQRVAGNPAKPLTNGKPGKDS
ncbi:acetyltransferase [Aliidiomarina shirensis]|uniref:Acetyltransferase n=1 Tax=Aliidiomarina shirensis TaxID=1048642 RepID=A0A432WU56_9GAMM|nr:acetyltransferase [Aliidiomarina shirensis]RUO37294.1 acetyltransferase [Aliidiomarina shirensis]